MFILDVNLSHLDGRGAEIVANWLRRKYKVVPLRRGSLVRVPTPDPDLMGRIVADMLKHRVPTQEVELHVYRRTDEAPTN